MSSVALANPINRHTRFPDNHSTKIYGAPELTHHFPDLDDVNYGATWEVDIWSLGCVFSEFLVWTICGSRGLVEFRHLRRRDTDAVPRHKESGYSGCFHDGENTIEAVPEMLNRVLQYKRTSDYISEQIVGFILRDMLVPQKSRVEARRLLSRFDGLMQSHANRSASLRHSLTVDRRSASPLAQPQPSLHRNGTIDSYQTARQPQRNSDTGNSPGLLESPISRPYSCESSHTPSPESRISHPSRDIRVPRDGIITSSFERELAQMELADQNHNRHDSRHIIGGGPRPEPATHSAGSGMSYLLDRAPLTHHPYSDSERRPGITYPQPRLPRGLSMSLRPDIHIDIPPLHTSSNPSHYLPRTPNQDLDKVLVQEVLVRINERKLKQGQGPEALPCHDRVMGTIGGREQVSVVLNLETVYLCADEH